MNWWNISVSTWWSNFRANQQSCQPDMFYFYHFCLKPWLYYLQFVGSLIALFCVPFCLVSKTSCYKHVLNRFVVIVYGKCWLRFLLEKLWRLLARWFISVKQSYFIWFNFTLKRYWWKTWRNNIFNQLIYCLCN